MRRLLVTSTLAALLIGVAGCTLGRREVASMPPQAAPAPAPSPAPLRMEFTATAYTISGKTASGARTRRGMCAADLSVLPLGSRIRVEGAGRYSGVYVVKDSGHKIDGREIDLYIANDAEAKRFGKRPVTVEVLGSGDRR
jgi:3D (Asp-Asp-Asp) domain-containing protein